MEGCAEAEERNQWKQEANEPSQHPDSSILTTNILSGCPEATFVTTNTSPGHASSTCVTTNISSGYAISMFVNTNTASGHSSLMFVTSNTSSVHYSSVFVTSDIVSGHSDAEFVTKNASRDTSGHPAVPPKTPLQAPRSPCPVKKSSKHPENWLLRGKSDKSQLPDKMVSSHQKKTETPPHSPKPNNKPRHQGNSTKFPPPIAHQGIPQSLPQSALPPRGFPLVIL